MRFLVLSVASLFPLAAVAQEQLCNGVDPGAWIGSSRDGSNLSSSESYFEISSIAPANGAIVSLFEVSEQTDVRLEAWGAFGADPAAELYNEAGELVLMNDDGGADYGVYVEETLAPGAYCMRTYSFAEGVLAASVRIGRVEHEAATSPADPAGDAEPASNVDTEAACGSAEALELSLGEAVTRQISIGGEAQGYSFTLTEPAALLLTANSVDGDAVLSLRDSNGVEVANNDDFEGLNARIEMFEPIAAGEYCAVMSNYNGTAADMTFEATMMDEATIRRIQIDKALISPLPQDEVEVTELGEIKTAAVRDAQISAEATWYSFTVTSESLIVIDAGAVGESDPMLDLFDRLGRPIEQNDDISGNDLSARVVGRLFPGDYMLAVRDNNSTGSHPVRLILERYVRAAE